MDILSGVMALVGNVHFASAVWYYWIYDGRQIMVMVFYVNGIFWAGLAQGVCILLGGFWK